MNWNKGHNVVRHLSMPASSRIYKECECEIPKTIMSIETQKEFNIDIANSILVGDKNSDIEKGILVNIGRNYLIATGHMTLENKFGVKVLNNIRELNELVSS